MALPQAIDIRISMLRLAPQCFAFTSISIRVRVRVWYYFIFRDRYVERELIRSRAPV